MDTLLEAIQAAVATGASDEACAAGASACRTILTALEARPGDQLAIAPTSQASPIADVVAMLRGVPPEQLLDLAISRLRAALPPDTAAPVVSPMKFHIIELPPQLGTRTRR